MPKDHGSQRRALKQRKRRQARRQARAGRPRARPNAAPGAPQASAAEPSGTAQRAHGGYHPQHAPAAESWSTRSEESKLAAVASYHEKALPADRQPPNMATHASLHVLVENQLAADAPPAANAALRRLMQSGLSRHDAVHAIGWLAIDHMERAMKARKPVDTVAYADALDQWTRESWLAAAGVGPEASPLCTTSGSD